MSKKKTIDEFIFDCIKVHGNTYDYSLVNYIDNNTKVKIICTLHGIFEQTPNVHLYSKCGCPDCTNNRKMTNETFIKKAKEIHGDRYDYSLVDYVNSLTTVTIICSEHGPFKQSPNNHISKKHNCPNCKISKQLNTKDFIEKSNKIHNNFYDYSLVDYVNCLNKVKIICPIHGEFEQRPYNHTKGIGCPFCNESKGEKLLVTILNDNNIKFIRQYTFKECKNKKKLPFDFYLQELNICIEYDGIQHYQSVQRFGGENSFFNTQKNDLIKTNFCENNNIELIRIKYNEKIIDKLNAII